MYFKGFTSDACMHIQFGNTWKYSPNGFSVLSIAKLTYFIAVANSNLANQLTYILIGIKLMIVLKFRIEISLIDPKFVISITLI